MYAEVKEPSGDVFKLVGFDPDPSPNHLIEINNKSVLRLGKRVYDALAASGYCVVPMIPTKDMLAAGARGSGEDSEVTALGAWEAMIAAR